MSKAKLPASEVHPLAALAGYADASVVSRSLMQNSAGSVTLFAFDAGQSLSEHTAPYDALVQVIDGVGEFTVGGVVHRVSAGEVLLMPADIAHSVRAVERFKMLLTMLRAK